jgi:hypothetical protein
MIILNVLELTRMPALASHADPDGSVVVTTLGSRVRLAPENLKLQVLVRTALGLRLKSCVLHRKTIATNDI